MSHKNLSAAIKIPKIFKNKLKNKRINNIYKKFEKSLDIKESFIVAVSGGPDSLALAFLAKIYAIKYKLNSKFFIVDHKLRQESTNEANKVSKILKKFYINSKILTWKGKKPLNNVQSLARNKRYELLFSQCDKLKINNILLGHHLDDLFENFFIRILRGSGLKGLTSLEKKNRIGDKSLLRPLLDQKKEDLEFLSKNVFNFFVKDPTNKNEKYQRIMIRNLIKKLQNEGLDKNKLLNTIKNLNYSNKVVDFYVNKNLKENTFFSKQKKILILNKRFFKQSFEITFRSLSDSIRLIGEKYYSVRGKKLVKIVDDIEKNSSFKVTLGGCIIEKVNQTVIISKEK
tara:strand:- start:90 stop:1118 length:1029 start_codon:yes stop_codon:yes gene_type:complete